MDWRTSWQFFKNISKVLFNLADLTVPINKTELIFITKSCEHLCTGNFQNATYLWLSNSNHLTIIFVDFLQRKMQSLEIIVRGNSNYCIFNHRIMNIFIIFFIEDHLLKAHIYHLSTFIEYSIYHQFINLFGLFCIFPECKSWHSNLSNQFY